jgi:hypothetical protein
VSLHPARSALAELEIDRNRRAHVRMSGPNLPGQLMQLLGLSQLDT